MSWITRKEIEKHTVGRRLLYRNISVLALMTIAGILVVSCVAPMGLLLYLKMVFILDLVLFIVSSLPLIDF